MSIISTVITLMILWVMLITTQGAIAEPLIERTVDIKGVSALDIAGAGTMDIQIGEREALVIIGAQSQLERLVVDGKGGALRIRPKGKWHLRGNDPGELKYRLVLKALNSVKASGAIKVNITTPVEAEHFLLELVGAVHFAFDAALDTRKLVVESKGSCSAKLLSVQANSIEAQLTGAGSMQINGHADKQEVLLRGAPQYFGKMLVTQESYLSLKGAAFAEVSAISVLDVKAKGASQGNRPIEAARF